MMEMIFYIGANSIDVTYDVAEVRECEGQKCCEDIEKGEPTFRYDGDQLCLYCWEEITGPLPDSIQARIRQSALSGMIAEARSNIEDMNEELQQLLRDYPKEPTVFDHQPAKSRADGAFLWPVWDVPHREKDDD